MSLVENVFLCTQIFSIIQCHWVLWFLPPYVTKERQYLHLLRVSLRFLCYQSKMKRVYLNSINFSECPKFEMISADENVWFKHSL